MKVGIIETGAPPAALVPAFGTYDTMTRRLLGVGHTYETFRVFDGHFPHDVRACDAYAITGSRCGVHDGLPWIDELMRFLRAARGNAKLVGICFGHQAMAQAFGGEVHKAPAGWGLGLHRYDIVERATWMDAAAVVDITASHQDQVVTPPPRCRTLAASTFTPHAILAYDDHPSLSVQFHPEFAPDFSRALLAARQAPDLTQTEIAHAMASLYRPNDNVRLGRWIDEFLAT